MQMARFMAVWYLSGTPPEGDMPIDLESLKPKTAQVFIDDFAYEMREPRISTTAEVLRVAADIELEKVVGPFISLMRGDSDGGDATVAGLIARMQQVGPDLVQAARPVLGRQFAPAVQRAAIACLDTRHFRGVLLKAEVLGEDEAKIDVDDDGGYAGCAGVRAYLREALTTRQAIHVVTEAFRMLEVTSSLGNLLGAFMPEDEPKTELPVKPRGKRAK